MKSLCDPAVLQRCLSQPKNLALFGLTTWLLQRCAFFGFLFLVGDTWAQEWITRLLEVSSALHSMKWSDQHCLKQYPLEIKTRTCYQNSMSNVSMSWQRIMPHIHCAFAGTQFRKNRQRLPVATVAIWTPLHYNMKEFWRRPGIYPNLIWSFQYFWQRHCLDATHSVLLMIIFFRRAWRCMLLCGDGKHNYSFCCTWRVCQLQLQWLRLLTNQKITCCLRFRSERIWIQQSMQSEQFCTCHVTWKWNENRREVNVWQSNLMHSSDTVFCEVHVHCPQKNVTVTTFASCC